MFTLTAAPQTQVVIPKIIILQSGASYISEGHILKADKTRQDANIYMREKRDGGLL